MLYGPIMHPIAQQSRYLPCLTKLDFTFFKQTSHSILLIKPSNVTGDFRIKIHDMSIFLKHVTLYPETLNAIETRLNNGQPANYYFENIIIRDFALARGLTSIRIPDVLLTSYQPKELFLGILEKKEADGDWQSHGFHFQHFDVSEIKLQIGSNTFPNPVFTPNYTEDDPDWTREYFSWYGTSFGLTQKSDFGIGSYTYELYPNAFCIYRFCFDRLGHGVKEWNASFLDPRQNIPSLDILIKFAKRLPEECRIIVKCIYDEMFQVKKTDRAE